MFSLLPQNHKTGIHTPSFSASCFKLHKTLILVLNHLLQNNLLAIEEDTEFKLFNSSWLKQTVSLNRDTRGSTPEPSPRAAGRGTCRYHCWLVPFLTSAFWNNRGTKVLIFRSSLFAGPVSKLASSSCTKTQNTHKTHIFHLKKRH